LQRQTSILSKLGRIGHHHLDSCDQFVLPFLLAPTELIP
jgi:hypothetical protein